MRVLELVISISCTLSLYICTVNCLEPFSMVAAAGFGTALITSAGIAAYCRFQECCEGDWIQPNITGLVHSLETELYGQHLALGTIVKSIKSHINNPNPAKALVLSLHGWTGGGKNYVSKFISEHLYHKGSDSKFVHLIISTLDFPHESKLDEYKDQLNKKIKDAVYNCHRSLFIFDEMDKMPLGLIDVLKPYLDHYPELHGVDYRKSIFIFLSNTGGQDITTKTLEHWKSGKPREDIQLKDFESMINLEAFNVKGGLWHSSLLEKHLISATIPFLPLERKHVKMCARKDLVNKGHSSKTITEDLLNKIADELTYFPEDSQLFSKTGCKKVSEKVDLLMEEL